ncbi:MAG: PorP/SprF family type IX secretion system membrane protein [Bacteroidota bacterium]
MNKSLLCCLWLVFTFVSIKTSAQDNTDFVQFFVNSATLNPSYVGIDGQPALYLGYRRQWAGVPNGPSLGQVSVQGLLAKKLTGGLTISSNKRGLLSTSAFLFTGGYHIMVAEDKMIRFGLSLGSSWNRVDVNGVQNADQTDVALLTAVPNNFFVQGNFGVSYHGKTFHGGITLPQLFTPKYYSTESFSFGPVSPFQSVVVHASNRFYFNRNKNVFEPYLIYRYNQLRPSQFELAALVHLQNQVWLGAGFRQGLGASAMAGIKLNKVSTLGYSFTTGFGQSQIARPSHEIQLAFLFGKRSKNAVGVYSFVNTDKEKKKKTPAQLAAERKAKQEALAKKYKDSNVHNEPHKTAEQQNNQQKNVEVKTPKEPVVTQQQQAVDTTKAVTQAPVVVQEQPKPERHEFVQRVRNKNDLPAGTYVIVGAFRSEVNAKKFSNELVDMEYADSNYGFISARNLWYVYLDYDKDIDVARTKRDATRLEQAFKDAWILTVE